MAVPNRKSRDLRIVARSNGVGIDRDVKILQDALAEGVGTVEFSPYRSISPLAGIWPRRAAPGTILFLERVTRRWLKHGDHFALIPNQERYPARLIRQLRNLDIVLCKTRHAAEIFSRYHANVKYIGFTSLDRGMPDVTPDYARFFHLAGGSALKGTGTLLELWGRHPEWPTLTIVRHRRERLDSAIPQNVRLITDYVSDQELRELQNSCGIHLCPSSSEGWGHSIVEAMSCAAVAVVTDAPPMNELVASERGVLVPYHDTAERKLGYDFFVDPNALESAIIQLIDQDAGNKAALGSAARAWFEQNDNWFRQNTQTWAGELLA